MTNVYLSSVTRFQKFSNNMGETEGNKVTLQKESRGDNDRRVVLSHACMNFALRKLLGKMHPKRTRRLWNESKNTHDWVMDAENPLDNYWGWFEPKPASGDKVADDGVFRYELEADAAVVEITFKKGKKSLVTVPQEGCVEGVNEFDCNTHDDERILKPDVKVSVSAWSDAEKKNEVKVVKNKKGSATSRRASVSMYRAVSLTPYRDTVEHHFAARGAGYGKTGGNPTPYSREYHNTAMQYMFAMNLSEIPVNDALMLFYVFTHPESVGGGNTQNHLCWAPESVVGYLTESGSSEIHDCFSYPSEDNEVDDRNRDKKVNIDRVIERISTNSFKDAHGLVIGGIVVRMMSPENKALLEQNNVKLFDSCGEALGEIESRIKATNALPKI